MVVDLSRESMTERNILEYLNSLPMTRAAKRPQDGRQKGHSDIICCHYGMMIIIEVKKVGEKQTLLQKTTMDEWVRCGAIALVATKVEQVKRMMEEIMRTRMDLVKEGFI